VDFPETTDADRLSQVDMPGHRGSAHVEPIGIKGLPIAKHISIVPSSEVLRLPRACSCFVSLSPPLQQLGSCQPGIYITRVSRPRGFSYRGSESTYRKLLGVTRLDGINPA